jgi:GntR family transcriptional regulator/MocR family aminotransferase
LRRVRLRYRERRAALVGALSRSLPEARVLGVAAGLFVLALLPDAVDEEGLVSAAAARGIGVEGLAWHRLRAGGPPGLVLGFANLSAGAIERGISELARALESAM